MLTKTPCRGSNKYYIVQQFQIPLLSDNLESSLKTSVKQLQGFLFAKKKEEKNCKYCSLQESYTDTIRSELLSYYKLRSQTWAHYDWLSLFFVTALGIPLLASSLPVISVFQRSVRQMPKVPENLLGN